MAICREKLSRPFAAEICRGYLSWVFGIYEQGFFICEQNVFICDIFSVNGVYFVIVVAVMGHLKKEK